jgi:hypothetical protein
MSNVLSELESRSVSDVVASSITGTERFYRLLSGLLDDLSSPLG